PCDTAWSAGTAAHDDPLTKAVDVGADEDPTAGVVVPPAVMMATVPAVMTVAPVRTQRCRCSGLVDSGHLDSGLLGGSASRHSRGSDCRQSHYGCSQDDTFHLFLLSSPLREETTDGSPRFRMSRNPAAT